MGAKIPIPIKVEVIKNGFKANLEIELQASWMMPRGFSISFSDMSWKHNNSSR